MKPILDAINLKALAIMMGTRLKPSPHTCFFGNFFDLALHNSIMRK